MTALKQLSGEMEVGSVFEFLAEKLTKTIACGKCGREMSVAQRTVMAFCAECSAEMGKKK